MEVKEAIILAGGLGTRLRDAVPDLPKCMAPVAGRPFLFHVINYLRSQDIERFIFSLGYMADHVQHWLGSEFPTLNYTCSVEDEPLGTGGAILQSAKLATSKHVVVANGDTLFHIDLLNAAQTHKEKKSDCTLLLKPMKEFDRYGVVELDQDNRVVNFKEKKYYHQGLINGGLYLLNTDSFLKENFPSKFSFEKDFLEVSLRQKRIYGTVQDGYFIDIGIPADYEQAQADLQQKPVELSGITRDWTLFIDRDGIINYEKEGDYIRSWSEFKFYENLPALLKVLSHKFNTIIVVSNQRGVGKGLMGEEALVDIHLQMKRQIEQAGGRIDAIYYCTSVDAAHPDRKPNPGMAFRAKKDFPGLDLRLSIMVGNKPSDMLFGKNAGMRTVFIASTHPQTSFPHHDIDYRFESMADFVKALSADRQDL